MEIIFGFSGNTMFRFYKLLYLWSTYSDWVLKSANNAGYAY